MTTEDQESSNSSELKQQSNKHYDDEKSTLIATDTHLQLMCSRWYTSDLHVFTTDIRAFVPLLTTGVEEISDQQGVTTCFTRRLSSIACLPGAS